MLVVDGASLQPLVRIDDAKEGIEEVKFSPKGGPRMLAVGSRDLKIYVYSVMNAYQMMSRYASLCCMICCVDHQFVFN